MIKKLLSTLVLVILLGAFVLPVAVLAEGPPEKCKMTRTITDPVCPAEDSDCVYSDNTNCGICCLLNTLYGIVDWVFIILIALSGIWISLGAFTLITSAGSPEGMTKGRDYVLYAAIGLIVALLSRAIPNVIRMVVGA